MELAFKEWEQAKRNHGTWAQGVKKPRVVQNLDSGICCRFRTREILIDEGLVRRISASSGMSENECLESILTHAVGHFINYPRDFANAVLIAKKMNEFQSIYLFQTYVDLVNDMCSVLYNPSTEPILRLRRALLEIQPDTLNHKISSVLLAYLSHQAKQRYDIEDKLKPFLDRLMTADFNPNDCLGDRLGMFILKSVIEDMARQYGGTPWWTWHTDCDFMGEMRSCSVTELRKEIRGVKTNISPKEFKALESFLNRTVGLPESFGVVDSPESVNDGSK